MKTVIDTNRVITDGASRKIITHANIDFFYIALNQDEILKHKNEILKKAQISEMEFEGILDKLFQKMILVDDAIIETRMKEAKEIIGAVDGADVPFIAAALALDASIWSDDKHFKKQNKIKVFTTIELLKEIRL